MDPITDVLTAMRVESVVYGRLEATAPWGVHVHANDHAKFSLVSRGSCWLTLDDGSDSIRLANGDFFLLAPGTSYALSDTPGTATRDFAEVVRVKCGDGFEFGGGGEPTTLIGGKVAFDRSNGKPLTDLLPPLIHIRAGHPQARALEATLQMLASETGTSIPGSQLVINRIADILVIQSIRAHLASCAGVRSGWVRALSDPQIGAALKAMHESIEQPWTVARLASEAGMSRSAFAQRFKELVGEAPLEYLTRWRMYQASRLIRESGQKMVDIAKRVGYDSDGAFNKAFKRAVGVSPGEYRRNGVEERAAAAS